MAERVTRRAAMAAGVTSTAALLGGHAPGAPVPVPKGDNKSWVGKTALPCLADPPGFYPVPDAPPNADGTPAEIRRILTSASWEVKAEKGTRVQVLDTTGAACWAEKESLVLLSDAVAFYTKSIKTDANDLYAYNFRGWAKYLLGKPDDAIKDFDEFLKVLPEGLSIRRSAGLSNRGLVLAELGKFDDALSDLFDAVTANHLPAILSYGWVHELKGAYKRAVAIYARLLDLRPADPLALNNLAWVKATCPDAAFRDGKEAVKLAKQACELTDNREGMFLDTLAAARAEATDFAAAVKAQELALEDAGFAKRHGEGAQKRLQLYKDKKPHRSEPLK